MFSLMIPKSICVNTKALNNISNIHVNIVRTTTQDSILVQKLDDKDVIIFNRPQVLNAFNFTMATKFCSTLKDLAQNKIFVILKGKGEKAFSVGGDIRSIVEANLRERKLNEKLFECEYILNSIIGSHKIPFISFVDGAAMGSGAGFAVLSKYSVATERTIFGMPETQIGFFPDGGCSYYMPRLHSHVGWYLALTGHKLKGSDVVKAGLTTHYCESKNLKDLEQELLNCSNGRSIKTVLNKYNMEDHKEFSLAPVIENINHCFSANTMEEIISKLKEDNSTWAKKTLTVLNKMCPTSLKMTFKELEIGKQTPLQDCLKMEYRLAINRLKNKEFYEGIRALIIDKDDNPKWEPSTLSGVSDKYVESFFSKIPQEVELFNTL